MPPTLRALLLTDVVDSTKLSETLGHAYAYLARDLVPSPLAVTEPEQSTGGGQPVSIVDRDLNDTAKENVSADWRFVIACTVALESCAVLVKASGS